MCIFPALRAGVQRDRTSVDNSGIMAATRLDDGSSALSSLIDATLCAIRAFLNRISARISAVSWAAYAKEALRRGETVRVRPRGHSMTGKVNDGDYVTLAPCDPDTLNVGDIVLVRVRGVDYLHLI